MNDSQILSNCPFCGGEAEICHVRDICSNPEDRYWGKCLSCHISGRHYPTEAEAIAAWNARAERTCKPTEEGCCPICGEDLVRCDVGIGAGGGAVEIDPPMYHNYCPSCGAKVRNE